MIVRYRILAERLRAAPPIALAAAKHAVYMSQAAELEEMLRYETEAQLRCFDSDDGHEGIHNAFYRNKYLHDFIISFAMFFRSLS